MNAPRVPTIDDESAPHRNEAGPDFIVIGAQKAGTRWLYDQLSHHPDFWMPPIKELHYFDRPGRSTHRAERLLHLAKDLSELNATRCKYQFRPLEERDLHFLSTFSRLDQKVIDIRNYKALFVEKASQLSGDITPAYSKLSKGKVKRSVAQLPSTKFVFIARDPVTRFWSAVRHNIAKKRVSAELDIKDVRMLLEKYRFISRSNPSFIVKRWRKFVSKENFGLFFFDDLLADAAEFRFNIITFLGGNAEKRIRELPVDFNRKQDKLSISMPQNIRVLLISHFADELRTCASELGGPATQWPARYGVL